MPTFYFFTYRTLSRTISLSFSPPFQSVPFSQFYSGIIISLPHPLLLRMEQNNKFQDHADAAFLQLKLLLWCQQKGCKETPLDNKDFAEYLFSATF